MMTPSAWNQFVLAHGPVSGSFLHAWEWGAFQKTVGETVCREEIEDHGQIVGVAQWLDRTLPFFGAYRFCPKGPIFSKKDFLPAWDRFFQNQVFLRVESEEGSLLKHAKKTIDLNPSHSWLTNVSQTEDELLTAMHPKTRYNIRVAQKHGVEIHLQVTDFESAWQVFQQTSSRDQFRLHAKSYYQKMIEELSLGACRAFLANAVYKGQILAANIMIDFGKTRTYLHGASSNENRQVMAPYLLHWELMKDAKQKGMEMYDWWGVAPQNAPESHPWSGISRFKRGFGGRDVQSPGTYDVVDKPLRYHLYQLARRFRRMI